MITNRHNEEKQPTPEGRGKLYYHADDREYRFMATIALTVALASFVICLFCELYTP